MEMLKTTALAYFKQALENQEFESCQELIGAAKKYGARQSEITGVIASFLRGDQPGGRHVANPINNRLRLLKEK